jgi:signal peptidase II
LVHKAVVDFLDFHLYGWHWPAFNVADSAITIGVALFVLASLLERYGRSKLDLK